MNVRGDGKNAGYQMPCNAKITNVQEEETPLKMANPKMTVSFKEVRFMAKVSAKAQKQQRPNKMQLAAKAAILLTRIYASK